jgi:hypothetical protein
MNCAEQFRVMAFAQLTWRESLRYRSDARCKQPQALCDRTAARNSPLHAGRR